MRKIFLVLAFSFLLSFSRIAKAGEVSGFIKEIFDWTISNPSGGITYVFNEEKDYVGGYLNLFQSKHDWLSFGLIATPEPSLGIGLNFNLGKAIEKMKGQPLVYFSHLTIGGTIQYRDLNDNFKAIIINAIKFEF